MKITHLFGNTLRDTHEYLEWFFGEADSEELARKWLKANNYIDNHQSLLLSGWEIIEKGHAFLSQPMREGWFVAPPKPRHPIYKDQNWGKSCGGLLSSEERAEKSDYDKEYKKWQSWQPLFLNHFYFNDESLQAKEIRLDKRLVAPLHFFRTLNDFATHCHKQGIELQLNEDYSY